MGEKIKTLGNSWHGTRGRWLGDGPPGADWHGEFRKRLVNIENYTAKTCPAFANFVNTWKRLSRAGAGEDGLEAAVQSDTSKEEDVTPRWEPYVVVARE